MMNVNKVIIVGRLTRDVELKYGQSGNGVAKLNIVTSENYKDKDGNWQDRAEFHNVTVFGTTAEKCANNLHKGSTVYVEGKLATNKWTDQSGQTKYQTQIQAQIVQFDKQRDDAQHPAPQQRQSRADMPQEQEDLPF